MLKLNIGNKQYTLLIGYQTQSSYRKALNDSVKHIFGITLEPWYLAGYWNDRYIPYTLFDGKKAVANVAVNIMDFYTFGERKRYIQIGTVFTLEEYRHRNLCRFLMEKVLADWHEKSDFIYLFANSTAAEMYPKFGFIQYKEYEYSKPIKKMAGKQDFQILTMAKQANRDLLYDYVKNSIAYGQLSIDANADHVMFYCLAQHKDNVYYSKALEVMAVATFQAGQLHVWDVFSKQAVELDKVINALSYPQIDQVRLGFTPKDCSAYVAEEILSDDMLFIQQGKTQLFAENKLMFPLLSHA